MKNHGILKLARISREMEVFIAGLKTGGKESLRNQARKILDDLNLTWIDVGEIYSQILPLLYICSRIASEIHEVTKDGALKRFLHEFWNWISTEDKNLGQNLHKSLEQVWNEEFKPLFNFEGPLSLLAAYISFLEKVYPPYLKELNQLRQKSLGIVYTPHSIISFMIGALDDLVSHEWDLPEGIFSDEILRYDPAMGSCSFEMGLLQVLKTKASINSDQTSNLNKEGRFIIYGNELNSSALLLGKILLDDLSTMTTPKEKPFQVEIRATLDSALTPKFGTFIQNDPKLKGRPIIIFGNPPYSVSSGNKDTWITALMREYAVDEPNLTRLYDDYVKFIRYAQWLVESQGAGVIALITNRKFLDGKIFYGMRRSLLNHFDRIWVVDLFGDSRNVKGKKAGSNLFNIQTGVCISFFLKKKGQERPASPCLSYYGAKGTADQIASIFQIPFYQLPFQRLLPQSPGYLFVPIEADATLLSFWDNGCIPLPNCFRHTSRAMISSRDKFMVDLNPEELLQNIEALERRDYEELRRRRKIREKFDPILENEALLKYFDFSTMRQSILEVNYRPFDIRSCVFYTINRRCGTSAILSHFAEMRRIPLFSHKNLVDSEDTPEPNLAQFFALDSNFMPLALNFVQSIQFPPFTHALCTRGVIDSGLFGYSTSKVAPLFIEGNSNISERLQSEIQHCIQFSPAPIQIFGYIYGILQCNALLSRFEPLLLHEYPRIPVPLSKGLFEEVSQLGQRLIRLHIGNLNSDQNVRKTELVSKFLDSMPAKFGQIESAGFSPGVGGPFHCSFSFTADALNFCFLPQNSTGNGKIEISWPCKSEIWEFQIGSIRVLDHWLKSRQNGPIDGAELGGIFVDLAHLTIIIQETLALKKTLDGVISPVIPLWIKK